MQHFKCQANTMERPLSTVGWVRRVFAVTQHLLNIYKAVGLHK